MPKAYMVCFYNAIHDPDAFLEYQKNARPLLEAAGGRFIARGGRVEAFDLGTKNRTVVAVFDSLDQALTYHHSDAYQAVRNKLGDAVERDLRYVEGVE
jgi:uncharacterized protein (DUF1330 family)